jgi:CYTH domain-containing protein
MAIENELKYVLPLTFNKQALAGWKFIPVRQGYLDNGPRIRQYGEQYLFTYKRWIAAEKKLVEIETEISKLDFDRLWPECEIVLDKHRYVLIDGAYEWSVDFLLAESGQTYFVMAEVEMPENEKAPPSIPSAIENDIFFSPAQDDVRFTNIKLADQKFAATLLKELGYPAP